jgi:hypothetical protein
MSSEHYFNLRDLDLRSHLTHENELTANPNIFSCEKMERDKFARGSDIVRFSCEHCLCFILYNWISNLFKVIDTTFRTVAQS